jgi:DNA recombination protein RmuC
MLGRELYERTARFADRLVNLGRHLERSVGAFNEAVGTYESRLLPQGRKLKDETAIGGDELPEPEVIDLAPRTLTALDAEPRDRRASRAPAEPNLFQNQNDQAG